MIKPFFSSFYNNNFNKYIFEKYNAYLAYRICILYARNENTKYQKIIENNYKQENINQIKYKLNNKSYY